MMMNFLWVLLLVPALVSASEEQENITAESGQDVTLTCRAPENNDVVEWSRADLKLQHVLVYWGGKFLPEEQHPSFKNRVDLQDRRMKDGDVSLILKNVTVNDTGTYECRVQKEDDDNVMLVSIITLRVSPPPLPPAGPGGGATEDGGSVGLIVALLVAALLLVAAGLLMYRKHKEQNQDPYEPPAELQPV